MACKVRELALLALILLVVLILLPYAKSLCINGQALFRGQYPSIKTLIANFLILLINYYLATHRLWLLVANRGRFHLAPVLITPDGLDAGDVVESLVVDRLASGCSVRGGRCRSGSGYLKFSGAYVFVMHGR